MNENEIVDIIRDYLQNPRTSYAIMIDGDWGSGKTYFFENHIVPIIDELEKNNKRKCAYISLYGVNSIVDIVKEVFLKFLPKPRKRAFENFDSFVGKASSLFSGVLGCLNIDLTKADNFFEKIDIKNRIICFDDLERCSVPIGEVFGFFNQLVEHNSCKVIILANESEIGKAVLNQNIESKYQVVLNGRQLSLDGNKANSDNHLNFDELKKSTEELFGEDILYKSIREKVIGITIKFKPDIRNAYDSIANAYNFDKSYVKFLMENKNAIIECFEKLNYKNLRTLIIIMEILYKIYNEMHSYKVHQSEFYGEIMNEFIIYTIKFMVFLKRGGDIDGVRLDSEIGYVQLGDDIYSSTRAFRFLENYFTTYVFSREEFIKTVNMMQQLYFTEKRMYASRPGSNSVLSKLSKWWELEDEEVAENIRLLMQELTDNKYPIQSYQSIIATLIMLRESKFDVGCIDELVDVMNNNIENNEDNIQIDAFGYVFKDNKALQLEYSKYVNRLKNKAKIKDNMLKIKEVSECIISEKWAENLLRYCEQNFTSFLERRGFIDLVNQTVLINKISNSSTKEIYTLQEVFKTVYNASNIKDFFAKDINGIEDLKRKICNIQIGGINKPNAIKHLADYLENIIRKLK